MSGPKVESTPITEFPSRCVVDGECTELQVPSLPVNEFADTRRADLGAEEIARAEFAATPWWLWWNVLSLDAPMVAVAWALVFAKSASVVLPGAEVAALGLVVWLIYTVDRLLDGHAAASAEGSVTTMLPDRTGAFRTTVAAAAYVSPGSRARRRGGCGGDRGVHGDSCFDANWSGRSSAG